MARRGTTRRPSLIFAAWLVFVQALVASVAAGAHASPVTLDAFGNPLCLGSTAHGTGAPTDDASHTHCCVFGCHVASAAPLPERASLLLRAFAAAPTVWLRSETPSRSSLDRASLRLRGPPRHV